MWFAWEWQHTVQSGLNNIPKRQKPHNDGHGEEQILCPPLCSKAWVTPGLCKAKLRGRIYRISTRSDIRAGILGTGGKENQTSTRHEKPTKLKLLGRDRKPGAITHAPERTTESP